MLAVASLACSTPSLSTWCFETLLASLSAWVYLTRPLLVEKRDDPGAVRWKIVCHLSLDLLLLLMRDEPAEASTNTGSDHSRGQERRREDQAHQKAARHAKGGRAGDHMKIVFHVDLAVGVAADQHQAVNHDRLVLGELLDRVPVGLRRARVGIRRDIQVDRIFIFRCHHISLHPLFG